MGATQARLFFPARTLYQFFRYGWNFADMVILGSFYVHLGFRISAYMAVNSNPALQPDVVGHPEVFMCLKRTRFAWISCLQTSIPSRLMVPEAFWTAHGAFGLGQQPAGTTIDHLLGEAAARLAMGFIDSKGLFRLQIKGSSEVQVPLHEQLLPTAGENIGVLRGQATPK